MKFIVFINLVHSTSVQIRDTKGVSSYSGVVVVQTESGSGTVNSLLVDDHTAQIICQAAGFEYGVKGESCENFEGCYQCGDPDTVVILGGIDCTDADNINDCTFKLPREKESHRNDLVVSCSSETIAESITHGRLRLIDAYGAPAMDSPGRLEIFDSKSWGPIARQGWTEGSSLVACRQMGFSGVKPSQFNCRTAEGTNLCGTKSPSFESVSCSGSEKSLLECQHQSGEILSQPEDSVVIQCSGDGDSTGVGILVEPTEALPLRMIV